MIAAATFLLLLIAAGDDAAAALDALAEADDRRARRRLRRPAEPAADEHLRLAGFRRRPMRAQRAVGTDRGRDEGGSMPRSTANTTGSRAITRPARRPARVARVSRRAVPRESFTTRGGSMQPMLEYRVQGLHDRAAHPAVARHGSRAGMTGRLIRWLLAVLLLLPLRSPRRTASRSSSAGPTACPRQRWARSAQSTSGSRRAMPRARRAIR